MTPLFLPRSGGRHVGCMFNLNIRGNKKDILENKNRARCGAPAITPARILQRRQASASPAAPARCGASTTGEVGTSYRQPWKGRTLAAKKRNAA